MKNNINKSTIFLLVIFIVLVFSSCASKIKDAKLYVKYRKWFEAREVLSDILHEESDNVEAKILKEQCENEILKEKLITLRDMNISGDYANALMVAHEIRSIRTEWNIQTNVDGAMFERAEIKKLFISFSNKINNYIKNKYILLAKKEFDDHSILFENINKKTIKFLAKYIQKNGKLKCNIYIKTSVKGSFFENFVTKYCSLFHVVKRAISSNEPTFTQNLYSKLNISTKIKGLPKVLISKFKESIQDTFSNSPWYHPNGKRTAIVNIKGDFIRKNNARKIIKTHEYTVQIPYTAYETVLRSKEVPYNSQENKCETVSVPSSYDVYSSTYSTPSYRTTCGYITVTKYQTQYYTENVPVTKYRTESRMQNYYAIQSSQDMILLAKVKFKINKQQYTIVLNDRKSDSDYSSTISMPNIGLYPHEADITEPISWITETIEDFALKIINKSKIVWARNYCNIDTDKFSVNKSGELALKCMRLRGPSDLFVSSWFKKNTGLSAEDAQDYLNIEYKKDDS